MKKSYILGLIIVSLLCSASFALAAVTVPNPLGVNNFGDLLLKIAKGIGDIIATLGSLMIIVAGFLYLTSAGNPEKMNKAKTALMYAIGGIIIGILAETIVIVIKETIGTQ